MMQTVRAPWTGPFWEGVAEGVLRHQRCNSCESAFFPPQRFCARCSSEDLRWEQSQGRGVVYSHSTVYRGAPEAFAEEVPYTVAIIELDEGYRMSSRLVGKDVTEWSCGDPVTVTYRPIPTGTDYPFFEPAN